MAGKLTKYLSKMALMHNFFWWNINIKIKGFMTKDLTINAKNMVYKLKVESKEKLQDNTNITKILSTKKMPKNVMNN